MDHPVVSDAVLAELATLDTPTVCNALELVAPQRRGDGYTIKPMFCLRPALAPIVGYARTATVGAVRPTTLSATDYAALNDAYYEYMGSGPGPTITVIADVDGEQRGYGAWWGEVNSNIHRGLGSLGVITDGSIRDLPDIAEGFQMLAGSVGPSHAYVHVEAFNLEVDIFGMKVQHGDLIHADQHGAVVIPLDVADQVKAAAGKVARREAIIIKAAKTKGFNIDKLRAAFSSPDEMH
ncbi:MAG TPA: RraA family protein [Pseudomonadales bacterium]|nr:RraA family protein [Pseudomonadales bacterium]